jgi:hypothetical protein
MSEHETLTIERAKLKPIADLEALRSKALVIGVVGAVATLASFFLADPAVFYRGYLVGWLFWLGIALGLFNILMINYLAGGRWGILMRRVQEAAGRSLPLFAVLALPFLVGGMEKLYKWSKPGVAENDPLVAAKAGYLTLWGLDFGGPHTDSFLPGFYPRFILYFAIWSFFAYRMSALSHRLDETGDPAIREKLQKYSAAGLLTFVMVSTFAVIDWIMSTDPHWYSSLYGPQFLMWQTLSAIAFSIPLFIFLAEREPLKHLVKRSHYHDYGKMMLAFTMIWGYFSVSQFLIIWSGNMPEEITWYLTRNQPSWKLYTLILVFFAFFVPFGALLSQDIKFKPRILVKVAMLVLVVRFFDYYWQIAPNLSPDKFPLHIFDFAAVIGIGGLWVWWLLGQLRDRAILPVGEPIIKEAWTDV